MSSRSDLDLIADFQNGKETSFNELVHRYQEKVYWLARRFMADHDAADDVVQEVFLKAYHGLKDFRSESGVYTWLYRITVNISLNTLRQQKLRDFFRIEDVLNLRDDVSAGPDDIIERREQKDLIEQAIGRLPEKQKAVFVLRYYDELPYEEIAKILKTSVGGLKANYFHAVRKIGAYLNRAHGTR